MGKSWSNLTPSSFVTSSTRAFARRLASGRLLVIYNEDPSIRRNFTVALSDDDGRTWQHKILIDPRHDTSYPDMVQAADGAIYIIHDCARYQGGYILISRLTEADIEAGRLVDPESFVSRIVSHTSPVK